MINEVDKIISSLLITSIFMFGIGLVFIFDLGLVLNYDSTIVFSWIILPIWCGVYYLLNRLDINLLSDICEKI